MKTILLALLLSGCVSNPYKDMSIYERAWQASHFIDVAQTYEISQDPCYFENGFLTRDVIGRNPTTTKVAVWGVGLSYGHAQFTKWLDNTDWSPWIKNTIKTVDLGIKVDAMTNNYSIGIRIGSSNKHKRGCNP